MVTEQEGELGKAICFTLCYAIFVAGCAVWSISNLIALYKKEKKK